MLYPCKDLYIKRVNVPFKICYQPELAEYFIPGEDLVLYDSVDDLIQKIDYYLSHEEERLQIAKNGYEKVKRYHTYDTRLTEILNTVISD